MCEPSTSSGVTRRKSLRNRYTQSLDMEMRMLRPKIPPPPLIRPGEEDPYHWPTLTDAESKKIADILRRYKKKQSNFKDNSWIDYKETDAVPGQVQVRPKMPSNAFIYGMSECCTCVQKNACWAVIVEAQVMPRTIVMPIVDECVHNNIPMVCLNHIRKINASHFGIYTGFLGIKKGCIPELRRKILAISNAYKKKKLEMEALKPIPPAVAGPSGTIIKEIIDPKPIDNKPSSKKRQYNDDSSSSEEEPANKALCSYTVTSSSSDGEPTLSSFKMVLKKTTNKPEERARLAVATNEKAVKPN